MMLSEDERPLLVGRCDCPEPLLDSLDSWTPEHFDDILRHEGVTSAAHYRVIRDYQRLPSILNGPGNRFFIYVARDTPGLLSMVDSPILRDAIEDGVERESQEYPLDGEPFTGNLYEIMEVRGAAGRDFATKGPILVERYDLPEPHGDFDAWLNDEHLDAVAEWPGVTRARTWQQIRDDVPARFPYSRYTSKGNRMILAEFADGVDLREMLIERTLDAALADSLRWDMHLPYIRREAFDHIATRPADA